MEMHRMDDGHVPFARKRQNGQDRRAGEELGRDVSQLAQRDRQWPFAMGDLDHLQWQIAHEHQQIGHGEIEKVVVRRRA